MLTLLVLLVILAIVAWIGRAVLTGLNAPAWLIQVGLGVVLVVAVVLVAQAFGIATPALR